MNTSRRHSTTSAGLIKPFSPATDHRDPRRKTREVVVIGEHLHDNAGEVVGTQGFYIDVTPTDEARQAAISVAVAEMCGEGMRHPLLTDACLAEHRDYTETPTPQSYFGALETVSLPGERVIAVVIAQPGGECTARPARCRPDRCRPDRSMRCASKNAPPYPRR